MEKELLNLKKTRIQTAVSISRLDQMIQSLKDEIKEMQLEIKERKKYQ